MAPAPVAKLEILSAETEIFNHLLLLQCLINAEMQIFYKLNNASFFLYINNDHILNTKSNTSNINIK